MKLKFVKFFRLIFRERFIQNANSLPLKVAYLGDERKSEFGQIAPRIGLNGINDVFQFGIRLELFEESLSVVGSVFELKVLEDDVLAVSSRLCK